MEFIRSPVNGVGGILTKKILFYLDYIEVTEDSIALKTRFGGEGSADGMRYYSPSHDDTFVRFILVTHRCNN